MNKFSKGIVSLSLVAALTTGYVAAIAVNEDKSVSALTAGKSPALTSQTDKAIKLEGMKVPKTGSVGQPVSINMATIKAIDGTAITNMAGEDKANGVDDDQITPTILNVYGEDISSSKFIYVDKSQDTTLDKSDTDKHVNVNVYQYTENSANGTVTFVPIEKGDGAYTVYYEYAERVNVGDGVAETRVLARSEDFRINVTADSYAFKFDENLKYKADVSENDVYPIIPTTMAAGESFVVPIPRVLNTNGKIMFIANKNITTTSADTPDITKDKVVTIEDFFDDDVYKTEEDLLKDIVNFDLVTPTSIELYNAASNLPIINLPLSSLDSNTSSAYYAYQLVEDVKDRYGREVKTIRITIKEAATGNEWLGNYTLMYSLKDFDGGSSVNTIPEVSQMNRGYNINVKAAKTYEQLTWSLTGTVPTTGVKGSTITLPKRIAKDKSGAEVKAYTKVWVTFIPNGQIVEYNPISYKARGAEGYEDYEVSDTMELKLTNSQNADGTYRIRYETFDPLATKADGTNVTKTPVKIYDIERVTDTQRPSVQLAEDYDWNGTSAVESKDITNGRHLLAPRVGLISPESNKGYTAVAYIPAVFASDNVSDLKNITITRNIYKKSSGEHVGEVNGLFRDQYAAGKFNQSAAQIEDKFGDILTNDKMPNPNFNEEEAEHPVNNPREIYNTDGTYDVKVNKGVYIYFETQGTYELKVTARDEKGLETTVSYEFTISSFAGDTAILDSNFQFVVQDTYNKGEEISFAVPSATQEISNEVFNVNTETYYYYGDKDFTLGAQIGTYTKIQQVLGSGNFNAIRELLAQYPTLIKKAHKKENDTVNLYIPTRVNEIRNINVFSVAVPSQLRRVSDLGESVTNKTAFVKQSSIVNFENSFSGDLKAPVFELNGSWNTGIANKTPYVYNDDKIGGFATSSTTDWKGNTVEMNFINAFQNNLVRLPDVTFADNADTQFDISVLARYLTKTSTDSDEVIYEAKAEGGIDNTELGTSGQGTSGQPDAGHTYRTLEGGRFIPKKGGTEYIISYTAKDGNGNATLISFLFDVTDTRPPVISHEEKSTQTMELGESKRFKKAYVTDNDVELVNGKDGAVVELRIVSGPSDRTFINGEVFTPNVIGTYGFQYYSKDSEGNESTSGIITVDVRDTKQPEVTVNEIQTPHLRFTEQKVATIQKDPIDPSATTNVTFNPVRIPSFSATDFAGIQTRKMEITLHTGAEIEVKTINNEGNTYDVKEEDYTNSSTRFAFIPTAEGEYTIRYIAIDINNNKTEETYKIIYGDSIAPTVWSNQELEGETFKVGEYVDIDFTLMDLDDNNGQFTTGLGGKDDNTPDPEKIQVILYINDQPSDEYANITPDNNRINFTKTGNYRIVLQVQDKAGHYGTHTINFKVVENDGSDNVLEPIWITVIIVSSLVALGGVSAWVILGGKKRGSVKRKKDAEPAEPEV